MERAAGAGVRHKAATRWADASLRDLRFDEPILLTRPTLPSLDAYARKLETIWRSRWLTNDAEFVRELQAALCAWLGVEHLSLVSSGTTALLIALRALGIDGGEVVTTPFTFPATVHALDWSGVQPVFCDVDPESFNLDPSRLEAAIGPETRAILAVHVFGMPCDIDAIADIGRRHELPVVYDAAHAMGVRWRGRALCDYGTLAITSFHATKIFTTVEGGAIVCHDAATREYVDRLRNFGLAPDGSILHTGINGKLNELQAAFGLLQLEALPGEIERRAALTAVYVEALAGVAGLRWLPDLPGLERNYAYFPVLLDPVAFGMTRDALHDALETLGVGSRKYFPLCNRYPCYAPLASARPENLPVAETIGERVLCLPLYGSLDPDDVRRIGAIITRLHQTRGGRA